MLKEIQLAFSRVAIDHGASVKIEYNSLLSLYEHVFI